MEQVVVLLVTQVVELALKIATMLDMLSRDTISHIGHIVMQLLKIAIA